MSELMELTESDIKVLKGEKRIAYVFSGMVLVFGLLFNILYMIMIVNNDLLILLSVDAAIILLSFLISYWMNKKINKDIREETTLLRLAEVQGKETVASYEAGSGTLHIPILGDLFPKLWSQKMRESSKFYLIIERYRYEVGQELYERVNEKEFVKMYFSQHSDILLRIELNDKPW
ncbi:MAG: hypothetical protein WC833_14220 [Bacteroidales bacterium]|jgi:hypothetical protein